MVKHFFCPKRTIVKPQNDQNNFFSLKLVFVQFFSHFSLLESWHATKTKKNGPVVQELSRFQDRAIWLGESVSRLKRLKTEISLGNEWCNQMMKFLHTILQSNDEMSRYGQKGSFWAQRLKMEVLPKNWALPLFCTPGRLTCAKVTEQTNKTDSDKVRKCHWWMERWIHGWEWIYRANPVLSWVQNGLFWPKKSPTGHKSFFLSDLCLYNFNQI